jgi:tetratricopeptide (TPR) repeat protein
MRETRLLLALAFARAGDIAQAQTIADKVSQEATLDTLVQNFALPTIRAAMKLDTNDPAGAIEILRPALKYDLGAFRTLDTLYAPYIRGLAYLQAGEGNLAAAEFRKVLDHPGLLGINEIGPLSRLGLARAQKIAGDKAGARNSYEDFLALWKDADPDLPILKQAKAEYAQLK